MTNPVLNLLLTRRSVLAKDLIEPGPTAQELETILRAGLRVPDHGCIEPWRIQVLHKPAQHALATHCARIFAREHPDASQALLDAERERMQRSPVLLVVSSHPDPSRFGKIPAIEQLLSAGALCQNLLIAAQALGYGAQWITGWPAYDVEVKTALGHSATTDIVGFVHLGTATATPTERPRPAFEAVVTEWSGTDA